MAHHADNSRRLLLGDYIVDDQEWDRLGGGGMGVVYRAKHRVMNREVAEAQAQSGNHEDALAMADAESDPSLRASTLTAIAGALLKARGELED